MHIVKDRTKEYPLLCLITRDTEGPEGDFVIRHAQVPDFIRELDRALAEVEKLDESWARAERPGSYTELREALWWLQGIARNCEKWGFAIVGYGD